MVAWMRPTTVEGNALPSMISAGRIGVTSNWSKVPSSRSRATDSAVRIITCKSVMVPIKPGIMFQLVSRLPLYQARTLTLIGGGGEPVGRLPVVVEVADDGVDVADSGSGSIGVASVDDHLNVGRLTGVELACEVRTDTHDGQRVAVVDQVGDVGLPLDRGDALEDT